MEKRMPQINYVYTRFKDFSDARNQSIALNKERWVWWQDVDDICITPAGIRDMILKNPHVSVFKAKILSYIERNTVETIIHNRLIRNVKGLCFSNRCHEDCSYSLNKLNLAHAFTDLTIKHFGYIKLESWYKKNARNLKLMEEDIAEIKARTSPDGSCPQEDKDRLSMIYYGIVNAYLILAGPMGPRRKKEMLVKALQIADDCIAQLKHEDPLLAKMWMLRGLICMDAGEQLAAKQAFHKSYDEWKHIEAAINLAEIYLLEKNWNKVIEILDEVNNKYKGAYPFGTLSHDPVQIHSLLLEKLGAAYANKSQACKDNPEAFDQYIRKAEAYYKESMNIRPKLEITNILAQILRNTNRYDEAAFITIKAVNRWPGSYIGWYELAQYELLSNRKHTAKLFFREALRLKPSFKEAKHNLEMLKKKG
jgi:tetratricopeptide (TPR) repeat protein